MSGVKGKDENPDVEKMDSRAIEIAISEWWMATASAEVTAVAPKAAEYGATDLAEIGRTMGLLMNRDGLSYQQATEIGIFFYVQGKIARWADAIKTGRDVSDDTLHDIAVYTKMMQRVRAVGGWPYNPEDV